MRTNNTRWLSANFGDILTRPKFPFTHKGVYLGNGRVFHNTPDCGEHVTDIVGFASGQAVSAQPTPEQEKSDISKRVKEALRHPKPYRINNNCEHTVTRATEGRSYSTQLTITLVVIFSLAVLAIAKRK